MRGHFEAMMNKKNILRVAASVFAAVLLYGTRAQAGPDFIVLGDSRPLIAKAPQTRVFKQILAESNLIRPDAVLDVGDLVFGYFGRAREIEREYQDLSDVVSTLKVPFYPVSGNHDIVGENGEAFWQKYMGKLYYSFDIDKCHFIVLDTDIGGFDSGTLGPEQMKWLEADLAANTGAKYTFVFMHKPLYDDATTDGTSWATIEEVRHVEDMFVKYGVDIVFMGHYHIYRKFARREIQYYITGGGGAETGAPEDSCFSHYLLVHATSKGLIVNTIEPEHIWVDYTKPSDGTQSDTTVQINVSQTSLYPMQLRGVPVKLRNLRPGERYAVQGAKTMSIEPGKDGTTLYLAAYAGELGIGYKEIYVKIVKTGDKK